MRTGNLQDLMLAARVGQTFASALKKAAGVKSRLFDINRVLRWWRKHPDFQVKDAFARTPSDGSVFIPLKAEYFDAFKRGEKTIEYRKYGRRWNERTCRKGRAVVLSRGCGKSGRIRGTIENFVVEDDPQKLSGWVECYGTSKVKAACITIKLVS